MTECTNRYPVSNPRSGVCAWCGEPAALGKNGRVRKYCSDLCKERWKWYRRKNDPMRAAHDKQARFERYCQKVGVDVPEETKRCLSCGEALKRQIGSDRFCMKPECRKARLGFLPPCSVEGCERPASQGDLCTTHYASRWRAANRDRARMISHNRRARERDAWVEDVDPGVVFERDGWMCHLCGERIPQGLTYPHPLYPTIDHLVPLAIGGEHSYANVAAAHNRCNAVKAHRGGGEQLVIL